VIGGGRAPGAVTGATVLALTVAGAAALAQDGGRDGDGARAAGGEQRRPLLLGRSNGSGANPVTGQTQLFANNGEYALRESNVSDSGGGAIHGCRTPPPPPDAASPGAKPCMRANNLSNGQAFQFQTTAGTTAGRIQVGGSDITQVNPAGTPFETNASGRVVNLNADMVDGQHGPFLAQDGKAQSAATADTATTAATATTALSADTVANGAITGPKLATINRRSGPVVTVPAGESRLAVADCLPGEIALSGGAAWQGANNMKDLSLVHSFANNATQWRARGRNDTGGDENFFATVNCLAG
jgi:hypothetical protein